jgi:hypothetical protein
VNKNNFLKIFVCATLVVLFVKIEMVYAQTPAPAPAPAKKAAGKKTIKIDYENDVVMGVYETPDASFINSRRMIKYKELFNRRTNFIEEIDSNKGLFNEYQK